MYRHNCIYTDRVERGGVPWCGSGGSGDETSTRTEESKMSVYVGMQSNLVNSVHVRISTCTLAGRD